MPFTPFHMGPGVALKSVAGDHFSLVAFGVAQVAIDIEPGIGMLRGSDVLHGWTHTYLGATIIAGLVFLGRPLCNRILELWNGELRHHGLLRFTSKEPLAPFSDANYLLGLVSVQTLHLVCVAAGIAGLMLWIATHWGARDG